MKYYVIAVLIIVSWLPAIGQRSSYDPAARQPGKPRDGFVDFALKQVNPQNKDYGCQIDDARKLLVEETIKSVTSWALLVALSFLILAFFLLLHQHREHIAQHYIRLSVRKPPRLHQVWPATESPSRLRFLHQKIESRRTKKELAGLRLCHKALRLKAT
jgi:hypothetical protein